MDTIVKHPELFTKWRDAGLAQVFVGLESFSDRRLKGMRKGTTVEQELQAGKFLCDLGILLYGSLIVEPDFTREDFTGSWRGSSASWTCVTRRSPC